MTTVQFQKANHYEIKRKPLENNKITVRQQKDNNNATISKQIGNHRITIRQQKSNNQITEMHQNMDGPELTYEDAVQEITRLVGLQKKILFYVVQRCIVNGNLLSGPITMEMLKSATGATEKCIKTTIYRLNHRRVLEREKGKKGLGGFCVFRINDPIRRAVIHEMQMAMASNQNINHKATEAPPSSNISINNNTTSQGDANLSTEWQEIDIAPLEDIKFNWHCLKQIQQQGKLTPTEVQESIWAFGFDLTENNKAEKLQGNPLNYFMGILRKGTPYIPSKNYMSPRDKALEEYLTLKRLADARRKKMEEEAQDLAYAEWVQDVSQDKIQEIIPEKRYQEEPFRSGMLKKHFTEHVWPGILSGILQR